MRGPQIRGSCDPRFERVRETFQENFVKRSEVGAAVAVTAGGQTVVDLWGGYADQDGTRPWERDTLVNVYSTTKGVTALCGLKLVEQGRLDLDAPVARYWPEFEAAGKASIPVRWLFSHRAGLAALRAPLPLDAMYDWETMCRALAAETPWWTPGESHGYHALTFGWLVGELVRRVDGRSLGTYLREEIAGPLAAEFHVGLPRREHPRVAEMGPLPDVSRFDGPSLPGLAMGDPESLPARAFVNPSTLASGVNAPEWREAEIPGANGHGTARGVARIYAALACGSLDGVTPLSPGAVERCRREESAGPDRVLGVSTRFGLGFMLSQQQPGGAFGPNPGAFGHVGAGGSVGFADPEAQVGFAYVMNHMGPHILVDPRAEALMDAVYASLA